MALRKIEATTNLMIQLQANLEIAFANYFTCKLQLEEQR